MPSRGRLTLFALAAGVAVALASLLAASTVAAHPLGNFTINHFTRIDVSDTGIEVYRVLDMAEFPSVQELKDVDTNDDGQQDDAERAAYADTKAREIASNTILKLNGKRVDLTPITQELTTPGGQGGLPTLRLVITYRAELPGNWRKSPPQLEIEDRNYSGRLGWREIVARGLSGVELVDSSLPTESISGELLAYPEDQLSSPVDVRKASFSFRPGAGIAPAPSPEHQQRAVRGNKDAPLARYANLIAKDDLSIGVVLLALLAATGFGAIHALSPGHGKTIVAAYLVGSRGTARHALLLGLTVTATHTSSVYLLGFITLYLSEFILPERLYPWLGVASGALIITMGAALFVGRLRSSGLHRRVFAAMKSRLTAQRALAPARALAANEGGAILFHHAHDDLAHEHAHDTHEAHDHAHDDAEDSAHDHAGAAGEHRHGIGPAHSHAIPGQDGEPVTWQRLVGLGIFGGLLPCPSAIVVMLSAISLHRVGFGLLLIVFFSLGLAGVLTGIGFALVYARTIARYVPFSEAIQRRASDGWTSLAIRAFPVASAAAVVVAGALVTFNAVQQF